MEKILLKDIEEQAKEQRSKYQLYHNYLNHSHARKKEIFLKVAPKDVGIP